MSRAQIKIQMLGTEGRIHSKQEKGGKGRLKIGGRRLRFCPLLRIFFLSVVN